MRKTLFLILAFVLLNIVNTNAQKASVGINYKVYRADMNSFGVASVLLTGEKEAVLIDAQFTRADALKVVAEIVASGKTLTTIYVSHGDPDYYFGLEVFKSSFPEAVVYASAPTIEHIKQTYQKKLDFWGPKLGTNGTKNIVLPQLLKNKTIELEGNTIEIKGLDGENAERSYVWVPSLKAIIGGVNIYDNLHLWIADAATKEKRKAWMTVLEEMETLNAEIVIAAHALNDENIKSTKPIEFTKQYLITYEKEVQNTKDSAALIEAIKGRYPNAGLLLALELGAKVTKGEMKW